MEKNDNLIKCETPTLIGMLTQNRNLIRECLEISNQLYIDLTTDTYLDEANASNPNCILSDLKMQNDDLHKLLDLLHGINCNVREG